MRLLSDGIDLLNRMLLTEKETHSGALDPIQEELTTFIDDTKSGLQSKLDELKKSIQADDDYFTGELATIESSIQN